MAHLSKYPATALFGIVDPMVRRNETGINAIVEGERLMNLGHELLKRNSHRGKTAIESNH